MRWPIFSSPPPQPRPRTLAERFKDAAPMVKLPRQVHHAIERDRRISFEESRFTQSVAYKEVKDKGSNDLEALIAGSSQEMKTLHKQLTEVRSVTKKLEMSYLFHYHRQRLARRSLAKITKVMPGTSGRKESVKATITRNMENLSDEEKKIAEKLLGKF